MADDIQNDNEPSGAGVSVNGPDAHGEAALLLVESLLHLLTERSIITIADAVDIVETAVDVTEAVAAQIGQPMPSRTSAALLEAIGTSLRHDL